jgi:phage terminase large subunit-like protein
MRTSAAPYNPFLSAPDPTTEYCKAIIDGRVVAGEFVKAQARRHLTDLKKAKKRGLQWIPERAAHAFGFFSSVLTVTEGINEGKPFDLLPWQLLPVGCQFGWYREDGLLRYRRSWLETGKGQAKSPLMAALGLYVMGFRGKRRSEVYAIANDKDQANVLFKDAVNMCRAPMPGYDPQIDEQVSLEDFGHVVIRGTGDNAWKIEHLASASKFQSLANGDSISGPRPSAVLADEIHEFKSSKAIEIWKAAIDKMSGDPIMILGTNTPATDQITGTDYSNFFQRVVMGDIDDDACFAYIARVDKDDRPLEDESCWPKSLPALGITFPIENVRNRVKTAKVLLSEALQTKRLFFGIPVGSSEFWIAEEAWQAVLVPEINEEELVGLPCDLSLDLSKKNDLTALSAAWVKGDLVYVKTWYWTTKRGLQDRAAKDNAPYPQWVEQGWLTATRKATIDYTFVAQKVKDIYLKHNVRQLVFDAAWMPQFEDACSDVDFDVWRFQSTSEPAGTGLKLVPHQQGKRVVFDDSPEKRKALYMPKSISLLEDAILQKKVVIENSPVTYMCSGNAMIDSDGQGNRCFDKKRSRGRIDGIVTIAMAVGSVLSDVEDAGTSFWEVATA